MSSSTLLSTPRATGSGSRTLNRPARATARLTTPAAGHDGRTSADCPPNCDYCSGPETD
ncbi:hypothetical protein [Cryptosporangium japonicum]|uniref:Uncharacterized protein n=1 Tax=Cryptosporangium japonicum TaxID=80872 RepID=A0ABP3DT06_9ACTN